MRIFGSAAVIVVLAALTSGLRAQATAPDARRVEASRQDLQALLSNTKLSAEERRVIEARMRDGDFQPGERIHIQVVGDTSLSDTFTVKTNRMLQLPNFPDISLQGVLRSELQPFLKQRISQFLRDPQLTATALIRLAVSGAVNRPGFYTLPAATLASDVIMAAGGPTGGSNGGDIAKATVRRGAVPVIDARQMRQAFAEGVSIDQLSLHSGDEFVIGEKSGGFKGTLQTAGLISGILIGVLALSRI